MATAEFAINNKIFLATKVLLFIVNYKRKLRIEADIRKKKSGKSNKFCKENKNTRESYSNIKESSERNKEISR